MNRKLIAGNWKMNGNRGEAEGLAGNLVALLKGQKAGSDVLVCPPFHLLAPVAEILAGSRIALGAQDCHPEPSGAFTGDVSAPMLADAGCSHVILGHSERRQHHSEPSELVMQKALAAQAAGLCPIICIGETEAERSQGCAGAVVELQLRQSLPIEWANQDVVVAYEPVWAIGTGKTATDDDVAEMHAHIRKLSIELLGAKRGAELRILYGGSVKPDNAADLLRVANVDGALVGGASLKAADFCAIAGSCP